MSVVSPPRSQGSTGAFYERLAEKKDKCTAICAVARKLAVIIFHVMTKEVPYKPRKAHVESKPVVPRGKSAKSA